MPKNAPSGISTFELCQKKRCVPGGKVATLGRTAESAKIEIPSEEVINDKKFKVIEEDVSDVMGEQYFSMKEDLKANMTNSMVENLPKPVIIFKKLAKGAKVVERQVIVSPEESNKRYGNLLDKYLIVSSVQ